MSFSIQVQPFGPYDFGRSSKMKVSEFFLPFQTGFNEIFFTSKFNALPPHRLSCQIFFAMNRPRLHARDIQDTPSCQLSHGHFSLSGSFA